MGQTYSTHEASEKRIQSFNLKLAPKGRDHLEDHIILGS